jgi:hypothetical protein
MPEEPLKGYPISENEVLAIRQAKLKEIRGALDDLFVIGIATGLYEKASTDMDYKNFEKRVKETATLSSEDKKFTFEKINSVLQEIAPGETIYVGIKDFGEDQKTKIINMLLSLDYTPPQDWKEIADHLLMLRQYYGSDYDYFHPMMEFYIDVALCKILRTIGSLTVIGRINGSELARIKSINRALTKKVKEKSTPIIEIFFSDFIKTGMKMYAVTKLIREEFIKRQKRKEIDVKLKPPSLAMIKEYLMADEKIRKCFKKKGRFWIVEP